MLVNESEIYYRAAFNNEEEIENVVKKYSEKLFGPNSIYLPQTRISTVGGKGSVPDALVIDVEGEEWFLVEAERSSHGTWEHIAPQVSRQLTAVSSSETRELILRFALEQVTNDSAVRQIFQELGVEELEIHGLLQRILRKAPTIAIPIDAIPKDLKDWVQSLRNDTKIWVIEKYVSIHDGNKILYSLPDETLPTMSTSSTPAGNVTTVTRGSAPWQELIGSDILTEGTKLMMEYGPRGMPKQTFYGIATRDGIELDGKVYSPSYAAVQCIQKAGSKRETANGWTAWRTEKGEYLDDLYKQLSDESKNIGDQSQL
jgi:hypothetical protein